MFGCCLPLSESAARSSNPSVVVIGTALGGGGVAEAAARLAQLGVVSIVLLEPTWADVDRSRAAALALGLGDRLAVHHHTARPWLIAAAA